MGDQQGYNQKCARKRVASVQLYNIKIRNHTLLHNYSNPNMSFNNGTNPSDVQKSAVKSRESSAVQESIDGNNAK